MNEERAKRKLSGILSADAAGYSRLMQEDEASTIRTLEESKGLISKFIEQFKGRVVDAPGDNLLAEFGSVVDATECAVKIQKELKSKNAELPDNRKMEFRIGVNLGDVVEEADRIYGDGINIAARIEGLAEPGGICISRTAYDQVQNKLDLGYEYLGDHSLKNIADPVRVYRVMMEPEAAGKVIGEKRFLGRISRRTAMTAIIGLVIIAGGLVGWNLFLQQSKKIEPASMDKMAFLLPDKPSIAVLPFENIGGDPEQDYIVDGITDNIITGLSQIPRIFVIAQNSSSTYKGKPVKIRQVSEELGVRYVLEGRVQKAGARLRINVQLIEATRGHHLWAKGYDRELKDIFTLQDEITQKILTSIAVTLTEGEQARLLSKGTSNLKAYLKSLQAREIGRQLSPDSNVKEREMWEETIEIDPEFSLGYSSLGWTYLREVWFGWSKSPEKSMEMAVEFAQKALDLDQSLAVAHALMGCIYLGKRQYDKAITWGKRAVTLSPNDSDIMALLAITLNNADKSEEAILYFKKATRLNPFSPAWYFNSLGYAYFKAGQYDDSIKTIKRALNISPKMFLAHLNLIATYSYLGRDSEAKAAAKEFLSLYPEFTISESFAEAFFDKDRADVDDFIAALRKAGIK